MATTSVRVPDTERPAGADARLDRWAVAIALVAALPAIVSAFDAGFVADDWGFLRAARDAPMTWWLHGVDIGFRPIQALVHGVMFGLVGPHPAMALVVMALLEVVVALLVRRLAARFVPAAAANAVALVWAALPNRAAPRLWLSAMPVTVCVALLLTAALAASATRRRPVLATALCCAAVLTYESGVAVGLMIVVWAWYEPGRSDLVVRLARPTLVYATFVAWNVLTSPKSPTSPAARRWAFDALFGAGLMPVSATRPSVATVAGALLVLVAVAGVVAHPQVRRAAGAGAAIVVAGVVPLLAVGASPVVNGPVDRLNVIPSLGVAFVLGVGLQAWSRRFPTAVCAAAVVVLAGVWTAAQAQDLAAVGAARADAVATVDAFRQLPPALTGRRLVLDPGHGHRGWYAFGWDSARAAIALRTGHDVELRDPPAGYLDVRSDEIVVAVVDGRVVEVRER